MRCSLARARGHGTVGPMRELVVLAIPLCPNFPTPVLSCFALVEVQYPTEPIATAYRAVFCGGRVGWPDQRVVETLVIALSMIMFDVFASRAT